MVSEPLLDESAVSILNVVEGCRPSDLATGSELDIQEEHRLLYVAMTRAKNHLERMVARCFNTTGWSSIGDGLVYASRTSFLFRIGCCLALRGGLGRWQPTTLICSSQARPVRLIWRRGCGRCGRELITKFRDLDVLARGAERCQSLYMVLIHSLQILLGYFLH